MPGGGTAWKPLVSALTIEIEIHPNIASPPRPTPVAIGYDLLFLDPPLRRGGSGHDHLCFADAAALMAAAIITPTITPAKMRFTSTTPLPTALARAQAQP
jgi:hypothetical protein